MPKKEKINDIRFDGFAIELFLDEDNEWLAHFEELPHISAFGGSPENALKELDIAWSAIKKSYIKKGEKIPKPIINKRFSGQFNVRIDKRIHRNLAIEAMKAGISLNALVSQKLAC
jgi:predicted HicB family RNase H-like nuclease